MREFRISITSLSFLLASVLEIYTLLAVASIASLVVFTIEIVLVFKEGFNNRFLLMSSLACGFWLSLGFIISFIELSKLESASFESLFDAINLASVNVFTYSLAFFYSLIFLAVVTFLSRLRIIRKAELKFSNNVFNTLKSIRLSTNHATLWLSLVALLATYFSMINIYGIRGLSEDVTTGGLPWWHPLANSTISLIPTLVALSYDRRKKSRIYSTLLIIYSALLGLYYASITGRIALISYLFQLLLAFALFNAKYIKTAFITRVLLSIFILIPVLFYLTSFLNYIRWLNIPINPSTFISLLIDFTNSDVSSANELQSENLLSRPLVLWPLAASISMVIDGTNHGFLGLLDIVNSSLNSLPKFLFPYKETLLLQENLLYNFFPFSTVDTADSPVLYAFASFGILGLLVYPIFISLSYLLSISFVSFFVSRMRNNFKYLACLIGVSSMISFSTDSYMELATTGIIRNFLQPVIIILIISLLASFIDNYYLNKK